MEELETVSNPPEDVDPATGAGEPAAPEAVAPGPEAQAEAPEQEVESEAAQPEPVQEAEAQADPAAPEAEAPEQEAESEAAQPEPVQEAEAQAEPAPAPETEAPEQAPEAMDAEALLAGAAPPVEPAPPAEDAQLLAVLEAIVYITDEPLSLQQIAAALGEPPDRIRRLLDELVAEYDKPVHGLTIREVAGGYKMATKPEHHEAVRNFVRSLKPPLKLSLAALETLAVIAYKQPVTAPEIMEIRGVQGTGVLKTLLDRKLIATAGRKNVIGKPILYKTTKEFLVQFGLKDLAELPTLKEFEEISRLALGEPETPAAPEAGAGEVPAGAEQPAAEEGATPEAAAPEAPAEEPPAGEPPVEDPPAEEPAVEDPPADENGPAGQAG